MGFCKSYFFKHDIFSKTIFFRPNMYVRQKLLSVENGGQSFFLQLVTLSDKIFCLINKSDKFFNDYTFKTINFNKKSNSSTNYFVLKMNVRQKWFFFLSDFKCDQMYYFLGRLSVILINCLCSFHIQF